jgi:hypothetical protein
MIAFFGLQKCSRRRFHRRFLVPAVSAICIVAWAFVPHAASAGTVIPLPPFNECPAVGSSPSCKILLVVEPGGTITVYDDNSVGDYDGGDDTLVGIWNNSAKPVDAITVSGPGSDLAGFDGDGLCSSAFAISGCPFTTPGNGYEGPGTSFVTKPGDTDDAEVDFAGGLVPNGTTYFSLEGTLTSAVLKAREGTLQQTSYEVSDGNEPSVAVDPTNANHVVVGYNQPNERPCGWAQTFDSGAHWTTGAMPAGDEGTDPTVRFDSAGQLLFTCLTNTTSFVPLCQAHIALARATDGDARNLKSTNLDTDRFIGTSCDFGTLDHPSMTLIHAPGTAADARTRAVVVWRRDKPASIFARWVNQDGSMGDKQSLGKGSVPFAGGTVSTAAATYLLNSGGIGFRTTSDGQTWAKQQTLASQSETTLVTTRARGVAYALPTVGSGSSVRFVEGIRDGDHGMVFSSDGGATSARQPVDPAGSEAFLPGACADWVGAYVAAPASAPAVAYTIFHHESGGWVTRVAEPSMTPTTTNAPGDTLPFIGDYTSADCSGAGAWFAWTDTNSGHQTIRVAHDAG